MPSKSKGKKPAQKLPAPSQAFNSTGEKPEECLSMPMSELLSKHFREQREQKRKLKLGRSQSPAGFDVPTSKDLSTEPMPDRLKMKAPPDNIADDPYGVNDPWGVKSSTAVVDRGEIWQLVDDLERRKSGRQEWEQAHQVNPAAKADELYPEPADFLAMPRPEYHQRKVEELFKHRDARRFESIKDEDIYKAIQGGPAVLEQLRDWERRWILDKEGLPPKRAITSEDLDMLYADYLKLLGPPGHKFPGCLMCEKALSLGKFYYHTIRKKSRDGGESDEAWHFRDNREAQPAERACKVFLRALVGFELQKSKATANAHTKPENTEREKAGKTPIPLDESRVDKFIREIDEGIRTLPSTKLGSDPETEEEAAARLAKELQASKQTMADSRAKEDEQRLRAAWQRYATQERFFRSQGQSAADALERQYTQFSQYYPSGLPYNGTLVYSKADIAPEDWERFKKDRAAFEEEEGKKLPGGLAKQQWDTFIHGILEGYMPARGILTEEPKATYLETLFSKAHMDHIVNTPL